MLSSGLSKYIETKLHTFQSSLKNKRMSETNPSVSFLHDFKEKYSSYYTLLADKLPQLLSEILSNMCIAIVCEPGCEVISFVINLTFLIKPFFLQAESQKKFEYLENERSF